MPKKGKKGKKSKKEPKIDPNALTEVDKTFYELQITDLNRKLARLRSLTTELEAKNEELKQQYAQLDDDRNDIIAYLKKLLQEKSDEIRELTDRLRASEEKRSGENDEYEHKIAALTEEYNQMHETLTSEIKLLEGKLNSLEEFRSQRDDLMRKFEIQEQAMEEQEKRHKQQLYETEKKFIIAKNQLKNDMELRLIQLSKEFHESTDIQIAATTHRVIRENIAINNELETMYATHKKLKEDTAEMKRNSTKWKQEAELYDAEKKLALGKVRDQLNVINKLAEEYNKLKSKFEKYKSFGNKMHDLNCELEKQQRKCDNLEYKNRILTQNLESCSDSKNVIKADYLNLERENTRLSSILYEAMSSIKAVLKMCQESDMSGHDLKETRQHGLVNRLQTILNEYEVRKPSRHSLATIPSLSTAYIRGDLGFVPKPIDELRPKFVETQHTRGTQIGSSFDEFVTIDELEIIGEIDESSESSSGKLYALHEEKMSNVFFDETIDEESFLEEEEDEQELMRRKKLLEAAKSTSEPVVEGEETEIYDQETNDYLNEISKTQLSMDEMSLEEHLKIINIREIDDSESETSSKTYIIESTVEDYPDE